MPAPAAQAERGGDAGHHLAGDAGCGQGLRLLAAAAEDERVAALQAHHALAFAGEPHQQFVDLLLLHAVVGAGLADEDALGVAPGELQHLLGAEPVVDDDIGLAEQPQRAERQQVAGARAGADQVDDAGRRGVGALQRAGEGGVGLRVAAGHGEVGGGAGQRRVEEAAAGDEVGQAAAHART